MGFEIGVKSLFNFHVMNVHTGFKFYYEYLCLLSLISKLVQIARCLFNIENHYSIKYLNSMNLLLLEYSMFS